MLDNNLVLRKALSDHMELDDDDYSGKLRILNLALILPKYEKKKKVGDKSSYDIAAAVA
jgi:hypothetical protein